MTQQEKIQVIEKEIENLKEAQRKASDEWSTARCRQKKLITGQTEFFVDSYISGKYKEIIKHNKELDNLNTTVKNFETISEGIRDRLKKLTKDLDSEQEKIGRFDLRYNQLKNLISQGMKLRNQYGGKNWKAEYDRMKENRTNLSDEAFHLMHSLDKFRAEFERLSTSLGYKKEAVAFLAELAQEYPNALK